MSQESWCICKDSVDAWGWSKSTSWVWALQGWTQFFLNAWSRASFWLRGKVSAPDLKHSFKSYTGGFEDLCLQTDNTSEVAFFPKSFLLMKFDSLRLYKTWWLDWSSTSVPSFHKTLPHIWKKASTFSTVRHWNGCSRNETALEEQREEGKRRLSKCRDRPLQHRHAALPSPCFCVFTSTQWHCEIALCCCKSPRGWKCKLTVGVSHAYIYTQTHTHTQTPQIVCSDAAAV